MPWQHVKIVESFAFACGARFAGVQVLNRTIAEPERDDGNALDSAQRRLLPVCWGQTGSTPMDQDKEIRVRTGNSRFVGDLHLSAGKRRVFYSVVETEGLVLAPRLRLEPTTRWLTIGHRGTCFYHRSRNKHVFVLSFC